jgi:hypothetical protein
MKHKRECSRECPRMMGTLQRPQTIGTLQGSSGGIIIQHSPSSKNPKTLKFSNNSLGGAFVKIFSVEGTYMMVIVLSSMASRIKS